MEQINNGFRYFDSANQEHVVHFDQDSFKLKNADKKIHDTKFKDKPTTFLKDALKRFAKNKSSVTSFIILGVLVLLALILPFSLPFSTTKPNGEEGYLPAKLFPTGTGFWDGTTTFEDITYDKSTGLPLGNYDKESIVGKVESYEKTLDNRTDPNGVGGYIRIATNKNADYVSSANAVESLDTTHRYSLSYTMKKDILDNYSATPYYIALAYQDGEETKMVNLVNNSTQFGEVSNLDVTSAIQGTGLTTLSNVSIRVGINGTSDETKALAVFLQNLTFTDNGSTVKDLSFSDANNAILNKTWLTTSGALSGINSVMVTLCKFKYDSYNATYGIKTDVVADVDLQTYIKNGWMTYDYNVGPSSFKKLTEDCPIEEVLSQNVDDNPLFGTSKSITAKIYKYKSYGYKHMPYHLFGTDKIGRDMLQYVFEGLRNSLGLGVVVSLICFLLGLIYGAIEGYFGGNVDIVMERLVDIFGNIPSIVIITICVLHLDQGFGTFILAMCLFGWIGTAAITRTQFYRFKRREYVLAARSLGASDSRLIVKHILPNSMGTIVTSSVLMIPSVIFSEAGISYLGLGLQGVASLGSILSANQAEIYAHTYLLLFPSILMAILMICFNLFGNGLRDAMNPSLKGAD